MCREVVITLSNIGELKKLFGNNLPVTSGYEEIAPDEFCLCSVDLEKLADKNGYDFCFSDDFQQIIYDKRR